MNRSSIIAAFFALVFLAGHNALAQSGYDLFQKGLVQERTEGDLDEAIRLYGEIIRDHPDDRALVAKTLVQMGGCYEKLGRTEAQKTYSRVLKEYGDQPEQVDRARARLAAIDRRDDMEQTGLTTRELKVPYIRGLSQSRDGSKLLYTATKNARENVVMRDLATGEETQITHYATGDESGIWPIFSPDGSQIAYVNVGVGGDCDLHIFSLQTGEDRQLIHEQAPIDWSSDGRFILLGWTPARNRENFSVLSIDDVKVKKLELELRYDKSDCRFSLDAQYVSYSDKGNLYLYHIETDEVIQLTNGSTEDEQPLWCPDGKTMLFLSQRAFGSEPDLCVMPVVDGQAAGDVQVVVPDIGDDITLCSLSQTGRLLYEQEHVDMYVCSIPVDAGTGEPRGEIARMAGGSHPVCSPDGKQIAYFNDGVLHVMSAEGNNEREVIPVGFHLSGTYAWAPDNDTIYIPELRKGDVVISAISVSTKEKRTLWPGDGKTDAMHVTCSPDGKQIAFSKIVPNEKYQIFAMDIDGTSLRQLTWDEEHNAFYPAWSPDGKQIAFMSRSGDVSTLVAVSVEDGTITEIFRGTTSKDRFYHKSWSPDGSKIVWGTQDGLTIGDVATGKSRPLNLNEVQPLAPCWSPDGTKILFNTTQVSKVMVMENFLPQTDGDK